MYRYWFLLHIVGVVAFMAIHGVSMFTLYRIRDLNLDRARIADTISFSGTTTRPMYVSLVVLVVARASWPACRASGSTTGGSGSRWWSWSSRPG